MLWSFNCCKISSSLDEATGAINIEDRKNLLPILMRILYGKFHSRETTHTSSRDTITNKRSTIIQFLSSCDESELNIFFNLIFYCIIVYVNETTNDNNNKIDNCLIDIQQKTIDIKRVIPLKKLLGILQTLQIIINKLGNQMSLFAHKILEMLCFISNYINMLINSNENNNLIDARHLNIIKIIKQNLSARFKEVVDF